MMSLNSLFYDRNFIPASKIIIEIIIILGIVYGVLSKKFVGLCKNS
jgi:hypothetical protein